MSTKVREDLLENLKSSGLIIPYNHLRLLDCVSHGKFCTHDHHFASKCLTGEFGLVYKAHLFNEEGIPTDVAVKTLKGQWVSSNK